MKQQKIEHADQLRATVSAMAQMLGCSPQWLYELGRRGWLDVVDGTVGVQQALHGFIDAKNHHRAY